MPYIDAKRREKLRMYNGCQGGIAHNAGELNFKFTEDIILYLSQQGLSYQTINDIIGALEGAKLEFYRRIAVPYENAKMAENGDCY